MNEAPVEPIKSIYRKDFRRELAQLINKYSIEQISNTPDFILAEYLCNCLESYERAAERKNKFFAPEPSTSK